jgi:3-deoxy-manno-octulosonate cytidylyltransferase (CMP-KDO synthetase)
VVDRCRDASSLTDVIVATDDLRIARAVESWARVEMTRPDHPSGTDRIAEVAARLEADAVVNIQGDEPLMDPAVINTVAAALNHAPMSTAAALLLDPNDLDNPNVVKVVCSGIDGRALYFSRHAIPYLRDLAGRPAAERLAAHPFLRHLGIYGYRRTTLLDLVRHPVSPLEAAEKLEQLRALELGLTIAVVTVAYHGLGVDVPEDVAKVEARWPDHLP